MPYTSGLGGLQHVPQTLNIGFEELLFGSVDGGIQGRQLDDGVMAGEGGGNRLAIENINLEERHVGQGRRQVEDRGPTMVHEFGDHEGAELTAAAGDQNPVEVHGR